jgi:predicted phage tail protein
MFERRIYFHGKLRQLVPDVVTVIAGSVAEAIRAVSLQCPQLNPEGTRPRWQVKIKDCPTVEQMFSEDDKLTDIHIYPVFIGAKRSGLIQILVGVLLVVGSFLLPGSAAFLSTLMFRMGALLIIGGVLQMMQQPKRTSSTNAEKNLYLNTTKNTVEIGTRIPILYGRFSAPGHILQFNVNAVT